MGEFCPEKLEGIPLVGLLNLGSMRFFFLNYCTCPPTSHTVKLIFLYSTVSTLNPEEQSVDEGQVSPLTSELMAGKFREEGR